ncbi:MAG: thioredoxin family protein [bacterium]|nr:thioredoxin family protein [bacterium]
MLTRSALALVPLAALLSPELAAQRKYDQAKMQKNFAEMQTHDWFKDGGWLLDFDAAKAKAEATGKPIFAYFTRTYAA